MTDKELKDECMENAEIDLRRYSNNELTQIREAMRMYADCKLKLFAIPDVVWRSELLKDFADWLQSDTANLNYDFKDLVDEYFKSL